MIYDLIPNLKHYKLILASGSPRRKDILSQVGAKFEVIPSGFPEELDSSSFPSAKEYCLENAKQKALEVYYRIEKQTIEPFIIIGSDTVVIQGDKILEKPIDDEHATNMLRSLQNKTHQVVTGLVLVIRSTKQPADSEPKIVFESSETQVTFDEISDEAIATYLKTKDHLDKAGGYGIQSLSSLFIKEIRGDYYTVVKFDKG